MGKANRGGIGEQALAGARNRYAKTIGEQGGILNQALSTAPGPPSPYEVPIRITRKQGYGRLNLDEAIHRELGYLQGETRKTGKEYMSLMEQGGKLLLGTWSSGKTSTKIFLSDEIRHILETHGNGTLYLLHSHPNNSGFSGADMAIMCKYPSIKMMGLVLWNKDRCFIAIGDGQRLETKEALTGLVNFVTELAEISVKDTLESLGGKYGWRCRYEGKE